MPCLKYIIENATKPEHRLLRGKTIECISLIGLAVGSEKFMQDAAAVMEMLLKTQTQQQADGKESEMADDDLQIRKSIEGTAFKKSALPSCGLPTFGSPRRSSAAPVR